MRKTRLTGYIGNMNSGKRQVFQFPAVIAGLSLVGAGILQAWLNTPKLFPPNWEYLGVFCVAAGLYAGGSAMLAERQARTASDPSAPPSILVTGGPFRVTRNPMYLGMALVLAGVALWRNDMILVAAPVVFVLFVNFTLIPREERQMENLFGDAYRRYKQHVRRWI